MLKLTGETSPLLTHGTTTQAEPTSCKKKCSNVFIKVGGIAGAILFAGGLVNLFLEYSKSTLAHLPQEISLGVTVAGAILLASALGVSILTDRSLQPAERSLA